MYWEKLGRITLPDIFYSTFEYCSVPVALYISGNVFRIFASTRDEFNRSLPFYFDLDLLQLKTFNLSKVPLMELGELGTFDDNGVMPSHIIRVSSNRLLMYYIGWNTSTTVPFRNSIGIAYSDDNGLTFRRSFKGPVLDRTREEPHFTASCHVMLENNVYRLWYLSCVGWEMIDGRPRHKYHIKYAESLDAINFKRDGVVAIDFKNNEEYAISVPRVVFDNSIYKMWYSWRGDYYKIGYAESVDGIYWNRHDDEVGITTSGSGWDSDMICYPYIIDHEGKRYMLYNGNGYGKSGMGIAVLNQS